MCERAIILYIACLDFRDCHHQKGGDCRQRIKLNVLMMPKDYMNHMLLKDLLKTKQLEIFKMDDQDSL